MIAAPRNLANFLLARIADDEDAAHEAAGTRITRTDEPTRAHLTHPDGRQALLPDPHEQNILVGTWLNHAARHDPTRVIDECAAKRKIVATVQVPDPHTAQEAGEGCVE